MKTVLKSKELTKLRLNQSQYHLLFCGGPDCCSRKVGEHLWDFLKDQTKRLEIPVQRTQVKCFRVCHDGPWLVVYPDGIWYANLTIEKIARILDEHITQGKPIQEWASLEQPLGGHHSGKSAH